MRQSRHCAAAGPAMRGSIGYPAVREAIAARVARRSGQPCTADNVAVVPGAQGGLYCAIQCLAGPGDEIIVRRADLCHL